MKIFSLKTIFYLLTLCLVSSACKKYKDLGCVMTPDTLTRSINLIDTRTSSQYYNQAVANFKFTQNIKNYKAANDNSSCTTQSEYYTTLTIQNATTKRMIFDYNVNFNLNAGSWNYQGTANIPVGASLDVGNINNNPLSISLGTFVIQSLNITYQ